MAVSRFVAGECFCSNVAFGSYGNVADMKCPTATRHDGWVSIDSCIASEIAWLWANGVATVNSCCGHGKYYSWVMVTPPWEAFMKEHYQWYEAFSGAPAFLLRTGTREGDLDHF